MEDVPEIPLANNRLIARLKMERELRDHEAALDYLAEFYAGQGPYTPPEGKYYWQFHIPKDDQIGALDPVIRHMATMFNATKYEVTDKHHIQFTVDHSTKAHEFLDFMRAIERGRLNHIRQQDRTTLRSILGTILHDLTRAAEANTGYVAPKDSPSGASR